MTAPPDDIISDILCRFGVDDLLCFRDCHLFSVDFDSLKTATKLHHPLDVRDDGISTEILGSCNGLLALHSLDSEEEICLWNPSTRKSHMLPVSEIDYPPMFNSNRFGTFSSYGFGYEPISDDYKLVRVVQFEQRGGDDMLESEVRVYSLRTNSWRRIQDCPFALHWVFRKKSSSDTKSIVVALDLGTEEYRVVPLPDGLGEDANMSIIASGGSLCLIATYRQVDVIDIYMDHGRI
ncbi:hypothetical protein PTKIN_Ptkin09bG0018600 [Pterospermum kingtungense]